MAKTTAPALSFGARGSIGGVMTFSSWKGRGYVRQRVIPANPQTTEQTATRSVFRTGSDIWKNAGPLFVAPWDRFADGQVLTGRNAMIGSFTRNLRGKADLADMVFSPGAKGGPGPSSISAVPTANTITVTFVTPTPPTGWTLQAIVAAAIQDGDPDALPSVVMTEAEELTPFNPVALSGLLANTLYRVGGWLRWVKPDGSIAYGPSLTDSATTPV